MEKEYEIRCDVCGVDTHIIVEDGEDEEPIYCPMCGADAIVTAVSYTHLTLPTMS